jgi:hypothetical protein
LISGRPVLISGRPSSPLRPAAQQTALPAQLAERRPRDPLTAKERDRRARKERLKLVLRQLIGKGVDGPRGGGAW